MEKFFSPLAELLPLLVILCFDGTSISPGPSDIAHVQQRARSLRNTPGTIWPKPGFHVFATEQFIHELATLAERHACSEFCDHFHAYKNTRGLTQWCDAFDLPLLIDESITETRLQSFCRTLRVQYVPWNAA